MQDFAAKHANEGRARRSSTSSKKPNVVPEDSSEDSDEEIKRKPKVCVYVDKRSQIFLIDSALVDCTS